MSVGGQQHSRLKPGKIINGVYEITGVLGSGGFATVYKGKQLNLGGRPVAIKVLNTSTEGSDAEVVTERFMREAMAAAHIQHPNVVMIHDVGFLDEVQPYIVMQPFKGHDLGYELKHNGPLDPTRALPLFIGALGALASAHEQGIIHRDLKPDNLVLTDPGTRVESLKLIDFGIARLTSERVQLTSTGQVFGTPRYMAPEYITEFKISPALDVYQMGLILAEALSGVAVVQGGHTMQCIHLITTGQLTLEPALMASPIGEILRGALVRDPALRYPDATVLRDALERIDPASIPNFVSERALSRSEAYESLPTIETPSGNMARHTGVLLESELSPIKESIAAGAHGRPAAAPLHPAATLGWDKAETHSARPDPSAPEPLPSPSRAPRIGLVLGVAAMAVFSLLLMASIGTAAWLGLSGDEPRASPSGQTAATRAPDSLPEEALPPKAATPNADSAASATPKGDDNDPQGDGGAPAVAPAEPVAVKVVVLPSRAHARISAGDETLGRSRTDLSFDSDKAPTRNLTIEARGYQTRQFDVGPADGPQVTIQLKPIRKSTRPSDKPPAATEKKGGGGGFKILK